MFIFQKILGNAIKNFNTLTCMINEDDILFMWHLPIEYFLEYRTNLHSAIYLYKNKSRLLHTTLCHLIELAYSHPLCSL
jgi:hypothetical protein